MPATTSGGIGTPSRRRMMTRLFMGILPCLSPLRRHYARPPSIAIHRLEPRTGDADFPPRARSEMLCRETEGPSFSVRRPRPRRRNDVRLFGKVLLATAAVALVSTGSAAFADHGGHGKNDQGRGTSAAAKVFTLTPSTHGNPEGVAAGSGSTFFVGATGDGTIYSGTVDSPTVTEFITGGAGQSAIGMK